MGQGRNSRPRPTDRGAQPRHIGLALAADVEQPGMKGDRHGKAGEDEVGGVVEQIAPALERAHGALEHDPHGLERIFADDQHDQPGNRAERQAD